MFEKIEKAVFFTITRVFAWLVVLPAFVVMVVLKLEQSLYSILQILSVTLFEKTQLQQALSGIDPDDINDDAYKQLCLLG